MKKFRTEEGLFLAEGIKIVDEMLRSEIEVKEVYATKNWMTDYPRWMNDDKVNITEVTEDELKKISTLSTPNQVLAVCVTPVRKIEYGKLRGNLTLFLDDIRDPGNLGTIIRTADWFGIRQIICSPGTAEIYSPKTIQSSMGSIVRVSI
ncbi:MAG TPA: RNA methyltransferase, partial [Nitrosopumilaceae archaeon]|nr:RNA methyltransferase [Nitrosopumilaceae archaeon]